MLGHTGPPRWLSPAAVTKYSDLGDTETAERYCLSALEVESPKPSFRCPFPLLAFRSLPASPSVPSSLSCRRLAPASSLWLCCRLLPHLPSVRVCPSVHMSPFCKDTSRVGSGPLPDDLHLSSICKDSCTQAVTFSLPRGRASAYLFSGECNSAQSSSVCWLKKLRRLGTASQGQDLEACFGG